MFTSVSVAMFMKFMVYLKYSMIYTNLQTVHRTLCVHAVFAVHYSSVFLFKDFSN